jgi:hypothetical protein
MITYENSEQGANLAQLLDDRGVGVRPVDGTPLAKLVASAYTGLLVEDDNPSAHASTLCTNAENELMCENFDEAIQLVAPAVQAHLSFARNVASPVVQAVIASVQRHSAEAAANTQQFEVVVREFPEPLANDALRSTIEREARGSTLYPEADLKLPDLAPQKIYELLTTGSSAYDEAIRRWIVGLGDEFFANLWGSIFSSESGKTALTSMSFADLVNNPTTGADAALAIFLIVQRLDEEPLDGTTMLPSRYKELIVQYRQAAIEALAHSLETEANQMQTGQLVRSVRANGNVIEVNGAVYRRWLETGGTPEVLAGLAVSDRVNYTVSLIDERRDELVASWLQHQAAQGLRLRAQAFNIFLAALEDAFRTEMAKPYELEAEKFASEAYIAEVNRIFAEELSRVTDADMGRLEEVAMRLVTRSRFFYSDAEKILTAMMEAARHNPKIDPREAALVATIEYVCDYVADQMQVY